MPRGIPNRSPQRSPMRPGLTIRTATNRYDVDLEKIPPGMSYEWKRRKVMGAEDVEHIINCEINGWTPVPSDRHPELMGSRGTKEGFIERGGQMLCERPLEITEEALDLEDFAARNQTAQQMQRLGANGYRQAGRGIKKTFEKPPASLLVGDDE